MIVADKIKKELRKIASKEKAISMSHYFKTGKGEYGEGDKFHGISVTDQRKIAKKYHIESDQKTITILLESIYHEERLTGIFILVQKFNASIKKGEEKKWVDLYIKKADQINNWDLVDSSAHLILGRWLQHKEKTELYQLATSSSLWRNRIAIVATLHFIRQNDVSDIIKISKIMLSHKHDLIHKATGWMLREAWKREPKLIESFVETYIDNMPRTMLRYTIEKMPEKQRKSYLNKKTIS